jgi:predicted aspartyl protease
MRKLFPLLWCATTFAADIEQLRQFNQLHRFFELRNSLQEFGPDRAETLFYRAVLTSRFGHEAEGVELLQKVLAAVPDQQMKRATHEEMASALERLGRYREAAQAWNEALLLTPAGDPDRMDSENTRSLLTALSDVAPEIVDFGVDEPTKAIRNQLGSWDVSLHVNGIPAQWIFDTGANLSTVTKSEAKRLGLAVRDSTAYVKGSTDNKNALQVAVANDVQFGARHIHNVVFLVLADEALYIGPLHHQITGILGLPVLRTLRRVGVASTGLIRILPKGEVPLGTPNLFFEGTSPIVGIRHNQRQLQMLLDTGANATTLYPSFREALEGKELTSLKAKQQKVGGAGGVIRRKTQVLPTLRLEILRKPINLNRVALLAEAPKSDGRYRDGVIGMDALWSGFLLDFEAMRLEVQ